ncbi:MAG: TRAP transporter substrate-binding protein [Gemmobacter sp.]
MTAPAAVAREVKIALDMPPDMANGGYVWANTFSRYLEANGMPAVEFERGTLGEEAEKLDQVRQGLLEVSMSDVKSAGSLDPLVYGVELPYLIEDEAELDRALAAGGLMARINAGLEPHGLRILAFHAVGTPTGIFNTRQAVASLEDMASLRMRALNENQIELFRAWGATGTIVSWAEVPNALQTGVADGYINPASVPLVFGHTGFIRHFTDAAVGLSVRIVIASQDWWEGLSDAERAIVTAAADEATAANRAWLATQTTVLEDLEKAGISVTRLTPEQRARFVEASSKVYGRGAMTEDLVAIWLAALGR